MVKSIYKMENDGAESGNKRKGGGEDKNPSKRGPGRPRKEAVETKETEDSPQQGDEPQR